MKTGGIKRRKISRQKFWALKKCFVVDCTAIQTTLITSLNRNTVNRYYNFFRDLIVKDAIVERCKNDIGNGIEADESYFGPSRVRGKRGRGAGRKVIVFGLRKRGGRVYTEIIPDARRVEIMPIIRKTVKAGSDIYTDGWRSYDALAFYGYNHKKVKHEDNEFATGDTHVNGIESFWSWIKRRLAKFNGVRKKDFKRYLLESEWRFNHRDDKMIQLNTLTRKRIAKC